MARRQYVRVLLVGEAQNLRKAESGLKKPEYFGVKWVPSVEEALELFNRFHIDIVIVGGLRAQLLDTVIHIRARHPSVPILVLPRLAAEPALLDLLYDLGVARYVSPMVTTRELRKSILATKKSSPQEARPRKTQPDLLATHLMLKRQGRSWFLDLHYTSTDGQTGVIRRNINIPADKLASKALETLRQKSGSNHRNSELTEAEPAVREADKARRGR